MAISKEQQNLIDNLRTPIKSFRLFALEEIIKSVDSSEFLPILKEVGLTEDDPECQALISHALKAIESRLSEKKESESVKSKDSLELFADWKNADDDKRMEIISSLPPRLPRAIRKMGPQLLEGSSPIVAASIIKIFGKFWPKDKFGLVINNINSNSLALRLASLRTMVYLKPELLINDFPALLASNDPEIKALAIRGLVKIDKEEALKHLQALLLSPMQNDRLAGIQNCPFFPFDMVKPLLLKYFAAETNIELLTKAGWIIEMNPDIQIPFMLFDIAERSPTKKAELVRNVLNEAVGLLNKSGILGNQFDAYMHKLQNWVSKRNSLRYVRQIIPKLDTNKIPSDIEKNIIVNIKQPLIKESFQEALSWPISEKAKYHINNLLRLKKSDSQIIKKEKSDDGKTVSNKTQNLSQFEMLASITPEKAAERLKQILLLISHKSSTSEIKIAAFQCLTRCKLSGAEELAVDYIKDHDVSLATVAVEYLGIVNPDYIFPYLGQCLKISDIGMKSAALGILKNFDYNQAISYLRVMLYSPEVEQQKMALECMNQFDFALIRDMLTEYLCKIFDETLVEAGLCHFAANPSSENVYLLYKIEQAHVGKKIATQAKKLREACPEATEEIPADISNNVGGDTSKVIDSENQQEKSETKEDKSSKEKTKAAKEAELKERLRIENEKKTLKRPAYAYHSPSEEITRTSKQQLEAIWGMICEFVKSKALPITITVFIIVVPTVYYTFIYTDESSKPKAVGRAVIAEPAIIEGEVMKVDEGIVIVQATNDESYILTPLSDGWKIPKIRSLIRAQVVPFRRAGSGELVARLGKSGYRYINEYSKQFSGDKGK